MSQIRLSVVIPAYNEEKYLPKTLESIARAKAEYRYPKAVEVIVVDNASTDRTAAIARAAGVMVVFEPEHRISKVRNTGARHAQGQYLLFVDADSVVDPCVFNRVDDLMSSGQVLGGSGYVTFDQFRGIKLIASFLNFFVIRRGFAWGTFVYCQRHIFDQIGGFDETLYGTEELEFAKALREVAKQRHKKFMVIREYLVVTSARRIHPQLRTLMHRIPLLFTMRKSMRDPEVCRSIWYNNDR